MITTVVIPVLNRYDLLERAITSLPEHVNVLVIDNGGEYDDLDYRDKSKWRHRDGDVRVLNLPSNLGVPASWNLGIKLYPFEPGWLLLNSDAWFDADAFGAFDEQCEDDAILLAGAPPWCCAWIGRGVVDRVGLFCEAFYPAYNEDVDYEERARRLGVPVFYSDALVHHENSSTIRSDAALRQLNALTHQRNNDVYAARWHGLADHETPAPLEWSLQMRMANAWD